MQGHRKHHKSRSQPPKFNRCTTGKVIYRSQVEAIHAITRFPVCWNEPPFNVYDCGVCGELHVGHVRHFDKENHWPEVNQGDGNGNFSLSFGA